MQGFSFVRFPATSTRPLLTGEQFRYEKWIKETPLDIGTSSRREGPRKEEDAREQNCEGAQALRRRDTAKGFQSRIITQLCAHNEPKLDLATLPTSPATRVRGAFLYPISAYIGTTPLPRCTIDQRRKDGVFFWHDRRTGDI